MKTKDTVTAAYLHSDGHCVIIFEKRVKIGGTFQIVEHCEIYEKFSSAQLAFTGRLVFHRYHALAFLQLIKQSDYISCKVPSLDLGSDTTKRLGLEYSQLSFSIKGSSIDIPFFKPANQPVYGDSYGSICSNGISYQPSNADTYQGTKHKTEWGQSAISKRVETVKELETETA